MAEALKVAQLYAEFSTKGLKETQSSLNGVESALGKVKGLLATVVSGFALKKLSSDFIKAAQSAENYRTSIRAVSDSIKEADKSYDRIRSWAEVNPVDTDEAIGAFVRLKTAAVDNCEEALKSVADLSSVMQMDMRDVSDAIVSAQAVSLRRMGILLNQAGKKAIIESNGIRKEVNKDIASIRQGIIDVMKEAYGGSMDKARDNYQGIIDTMGGMWTGFKQRIMEGTNGPFEALKVKLGDIRDRWEAWMKTDGFDKLVENIQSNLVSAINAADTAMKTLGEGIQFAYKHADMLKIAIQALIALKLATYFGAIEAGMVAFAAYTTKISLAIAATNTLAIQTQVATGSINLLTATVIRAKALLVSFAATIGPGGLIAAAVGAGIFLVLRNQMNKAKEAADNLHKEMSDLQTFLNGASLESTKSELSSVQTEMMRTQSKVLDLRMELSRLVDDPLAGFGQEMKMDGLRETIDKYEAKLKTLGEKRKAIEADIKNKETTGNIIKKDTSAIKSDTGTKGKSAAEKLVENIRDQMKYLGADGNSFTGVLDKWLAKLKPLSADWKVIKDLVNDIYGQTIQEDSSKADRVLERIEREKQAIKDQAEMMKNANSEYLADLTQRYNMALITDQQYFDSAMGEWEGFLADLAEKGLELKNLVTIPPEAIEAFNAAKDAALQFADSGMAKLRQEFDTGSLSFEVYIEKIRTLLESLGVAPDVINSILADVEHQTEKNKKGIIDLNELTTKWVQDLQSGIVDAIVDGGNLADTLVNIGKEIEKMILQLLLFGQDGKSGLGGGLLKLLGFHSGGVIGSDAPTFTRQIKLPKFHTGGIVGVGEELAVLKKGEGVFTEAQMDALGDMGGIGKIEVNVDVTNNGSGGNMTEKQADQLGRTIREVVKAEVTNSMYDYARSGMLRTA